MKILHCADLHVGDSRTLPGYLDRQRQALYALTDVAVSHHVDAMLICGDVFDAPHMKPHEKDMFLGWLLVTDRRAQEHGFHVVIENGNHDEIDEGYTHLHGYRVLQDAGLLRATIVVEYDPEMVSIGNLHIAVLPARKYRGADIIEIVQGLRDKLIAKLGHDPKYLVAMVHEAVQGAQNEAGTWSVKSGPRLDPDLVTYWALGDIHKPFQQVAPNAWYPGSPIQHDFGDISADRGCLIVDLNDPCNPTPVILPGITPLVTLYDIPEQWPEAIVRYEGPAEEIAEQDFPDNVVAFKATAPTQEVHVTLTADKLKGIDDVIKSIPDAYREDVLHLIETSI